MLVFLVFAASYQLSEVGDLPDDVLNEHGFYKICKYENEVINSVVAVFKCKRNIDSKLSQR